jgi:hypothetical protein
VVQDRTSKDSLFHLPDEVLQHGSGEGWIIHEHAANETIPVLAGAGPIRRRELGEKRLDNQVVP